MFTPLRNWIARSPNNAVTYGIILMVLSFFFFSISNVLVKELSQSYSIGQILFSRCFFFCVFSIPLIAVGKDKISFTKLVNPPKKKLLFLRGALVALSLWGIFYGFKVLPLANATVLCFSEIFFMSILAIPMLKESVTKKQWIAMIIGFSGVIIALRPTADLFDLAHIGPIMVVVGALLDGLVIMYPRKLIKYLSASAIMFYYSVCSLPFVGILLYIDWQPLSLNLRDAGFFLFQAFISFLGQLAATHAFRYGPTATLAPMIFSSLIWGVLFGFMFWGEIPDIYTCLGALLIIVAGVYVVRHERQAIPRVIDAP